ncbi:MAG: sugar O-acetyltransferase [Clostridia bacterium]|nr:sugar O-acetyltransferase [Clostridia bacterium]
MYGKDEKKKMLAGKLFCHRDNQELADDIKKCRMLVRRYNETTEEEADYRRELLRELLGGCGERFRIEPPVHFDYGSNTYLGEHFYANFDCVFLDVNRITIGSDVLLGPKVCIFTAGHPIDATIRNEALQYGFPVTIGNNVWIGGNTVVNPGVTIGDNAVIGSGSVVTRDIPPDVVAAGNPCRVIRPITEKDRDYWRALRDEYFASDD